METHSIPVFLPGKSYRQKSLGEWVGVWVWVWVWVWMWMCVTNQILDENTFKFIPISQFTIFTIPTVDSTGKHDVTQVLDLINWAYCGMKNILTYLKLQYLNPAESFAKTELHAFIIH